MFLHRQGINGYRWTGTYDPQKKDRLVSDICTSLISSEARFKFNSTNRRKYGITHEDYM
jgi:hypothetical protein